VSAAMGIKEASFSTDEILKAITSGKDRMVFNHLYDDCLPKIERFILRNNGDKDEAYDIFQDAILIFYKQVKLNRFKKEYEVQGFIYTVGRNLWINRIKKRNKQISMDDQVLLAETNPLQDLITKERENIISEVLSLLGERCKTLLTFSIYHNYSLDNIRKIMGFSTVNAVKTKHYKCKQRLIKLVKDNKEFKNTLQNG